MSIDQMEYCGDCPSYSDCDKRACMYSETSRPGSTAKDREQGMHWFWLAAMLGAVVALPFVVFAFFWVELGFVAKSAWMAATGKRNFGRTYRECHDALARCVFGE